MQYCISSSPCVCNCGNIRCEGSLLKFLMKSRSRTDRLGRQCRKQGMSDYVRQCQLLQGMHSAIHMSWEQVNHTIVKPQWLAFPPAQKLSANFICHLSTKAHRQTFNSAERHGASAAQCYVSAPSTNFCPKGSQMHHVRFPMLSGIQGGPCSSLIDAHG